MVVARRRARTVQAPPGQVRSDKQVAALFLMWTAARAVSHRGYVVVSGLYFVLTARLGAAELLVLGTAMSLTLLCTDIPAGAWSDAFSRKWPLAAGHGLLGAGMLMTGLVRSLALLVVTQVLWALGWALSMGNDVAWVTDELADTARIDRLLTARARVELAGGAVGIVGFGLLGWAIGLVTALVVSALLMIGVGFGVATLFREDRFTPAPARIAATLANLRGGARASFRDAQIRRVLVATFLLNAAAMSSWVVPKQLVALGFPDDPRLWYAGLGLVGSAMGYASLQVVEARIEGTEGARRSYVFAALLGVAGLLLLALAPDALVGGVGFVLMAGIAANVTRAVSVIWVNRRSPREVRATVQSVLSQAESVGEVLGGVALALVARPAGTGSALIGAAALVAAAAVVIGSRYRS